MWDSNFDNLVSLCLEQSEIESSAHLDTQTTQYHSQCDCEVPRKKLVAASGPGTLLLAPAVTPSSALAALTVGNNIAVGHNIAVANNFRIIRKQFRKIIYNELTTITRLCTALEYPCYSYGSDTFRYHSADSC